MLYGFAGVAAALSLLLVAPQFAPFRNGLLLLLIAVVGFGLRELRYKEFDFIGRLLFGGELQNSLQESLWLDKLGAALAAATDDEGRWLVLAGAAGECGWSRVRWDGPDRPREILLAHEAEPSWIFSVPLGEMGSVEIEGGRRARGVDLARFASVLKESAEPNAVALENPKAAAVEAL